MRNAAQEHITARAGSVARCYVKSKGGRLQPAAKRPISAPNPLPQHSLAEPSPPPPLRPNPIYTPIAVVQHTMWIVALPRVPRVTFILSHLRRDSFHSDTSPAATRPCDLHEP